MYSYTETIAVWVVRAKRKDKTAVTVLVKSVIKIFIYLLIYIMVMAHYIDLYQCSIQVLALKLKFVIILFTFIINGINNKRKAGSS